MWLNFIEPNFWIFCWTYLVNSIYSQCCTVMFIVLCILTASLIRKILLGFCIISTVLFVYFFLHSVQLIMFWINVLFIFIFFFLSIESEVFKFVLFFFRIPAPHIVAARAYHMASSPSGSCASNSSITTSYSSSNQEKTPLYRLAKLLNQTIKSSDQHIVLKDDAPRRLSWER